MDIPLRLVGTARSADFARHAADRQPDPLVQRCRRRVLGLFTVERACAPCAAA
ncbi:MAG TPA: hypothetical protein VLA59_08350 [Patescibacteria group bacterium]|nr:hypothetical protein [Patescibacteria group bacterium]